MQKELPGCPISATPKAKEMLDRLQSLHGGIILHVTGGCCDARTPLCLPAGEFRLGARDILLGVVEGVPVYEMQSTPDDCGCCGIYVLDMTPGHPVGFSLDAGEGLRFTIREQVGVPADCVSKASETKHSGAKHDCC